MTVHHKNYVHNTYVIVCHVGTHCDLRIMIIGIDTNIEVNVVSLTTLEAHHNVLWNNSLKFRILEVK